ncbi:MAG: glycosyltransferase family 2 protein [Lentisphaeria bacterium]|nr:glycosyltransferase family 2 protein [Lentisphaeria bacterium]
MLSFIIPLKSKQVSSDWEEVCANLERTLRSASNQESDDFQIILVCHEKPLLIKEFEKLIILEAPFPIPEIVENKEQQLANYRTDKGRKILMGLNYCRIEDPEGFFMVLDADDLVSARLAKYVSDHKSSNGFYFHEGFMMKSYEPFFLFKRTLFYHECGSSFIIKNKRAPFPEELNYEEDISNYYIRRYEVHAYIPDCMNRLGFPLEQLPFPGAIYVFNTQNIFATSHRKKYIHREIARFFLKSCFFSKKKQAEFY